MLKQMRQRVILAAMLVFFAVAFLIAALVNIVNYCVVSGRADETLSAILSFEAGSPFYEESGGEAVQEPGQKPVMGPPERPFMGLPDVEANYMTRFFVVRVDA